MYRHIAVFSCAKCSAGVLEKLNHDCFPHDEPWDTFDWYAIDRTDMARLLELAQRCTEPPSWDCRCPAHTAFLAACQELPHARCPQEELPPFVGVGETFPVTVEFENGRPRLIPRHPSQGTELGTR